ncbi:MULTISPECIES: hypothetical protein [unclassified Brevundimonas]|uniref:hypothetical protein n=1 Tax=unclassified Brevundimonas TaxID=2622653 RepID=UPI0025C30AED|nr:MULTISPECIES: hypothetical protein [unclassified Brevundimonas]
MQSSALAVIATDTEALIPPKPVIRLVVGQDDVAVYEAERILALIGLYYVVSCQLVRLVPNGTSFQCEVINNQTLYVLLCELFEWQIKNHKGDWVTCNPPLRIVNALLHNQDRKHLKTLKGIANQPYLHNRSFVTTAGFNAETGIYAAFDDSDFLDLINVTEEDARFRLMQLKAELAEFEFETPADLSAALVAILTAVLRTGLPLAPAFNINATVSGSGKSFLAKIIALFATPLPPYVTSYPTKAEEASKLILAMLLEKPPVVLFDDMQTDWKPFGAINKALTSPTTTERVLGSSRTATASTNSLFLGTGNNVVPIKDMRRRVVTIRLAPKSDAASLRTFEHDPYKQVARYRNAFVSFALSIIQAYLLHGKRDETITPIGSYEEWSELCREPLIWLGEPDPASSLINQVTDNTDNEALGVFLQEWRKFYIEKSVTVRELISVPHTHSNAKTPLLEIIQELPVTERGSVNPHMMGHYLKRHRGVRVNGLRIEDGKSSERKAWCVLTDDE